MPDEIIDGLMQWAERSAIIKHLSIYQKTAAEWDQYRKKIDDDLLEKWALVLSECRINGFIKPKIENGVLVWSQVKGFKRNYQNSDRCTLCQRTTRGGDCKGIKIYKNQQMMFKPCW